jgi:hypothetical protein
MKLVNGEQSVDISNFQRWSVYVCDGKLQQSHRPYVANNRTEDCKLKTTKT